MSKQKVSNYVGIPAKDFLKYYVPNAIALINRVQLSHNGFELPESYGRENYVKVCAKDVSRYFVKDAIVLVSRIQLEQNGFQVSDSEKISITNVKPSEILPKEPNVIESISETEDSGIEFEVF